MLQADHWKRKLKFAKDRAIPKTGCPVHVYCIPFQVDIVIFKEKVFPLYLVAEFLFVHDAGVAVRGRVSSCRTNEGGGSSPLELLHGSC